MYRLRRRRMLHASYVYTQAVPPVALPRDISADRL